ncbi:AI-2E family transporter [Herbidospora sp. NBRC 101105]|uniref:AI-2E family transporter n=1 Tax=Herbidospora sp. NBRC 101105 TaxID=3032195 RepID=UPI0024A49F61|nr:AI-2E family transporter [Herbidospora sp. NBRC 101105]GLX93603.1 AI-2E family transporter [Herbidospora sp. NBRC 101105]
MAHPAEEGDGLTRAAKTAGRILILIALTAVILWMVYQVKTVAISIILAVFITTLMMPLARALRDIGLNRTLSTVGAFIGVIVVLAAFIALLVPPTIDGFAELNASIGQVVTDLQKTAAGFGLDQAKIQEIVVDVQTYLSQRGQEIASGALTGVRTAGEIVVGGVLALILAVYLVHGGDHLVHWVADLAPRGSRGHILNTCRIVFDVIGRYVRGVAAVGFVDAFFIGITLWVLGVPIALPLAVLTFVGAFLPVIGALFAGLLAAVVAFVAKGWIVAVIVIAVTILVQQLEGHVLAPLIYGKALDLPGAVILVALAVGSVVAGIMGAFLAAPVASVIVALIRNAKGRSPDEGPPAAPPEPPPPARPAVA